MAIFNFPYHQFETEYPEDGFRTQLGGGYSYAAAPTSPPQRKITLSFELMKYFVDEDNLINSYQSPEINMAVLEDFFKFHRLHEPFVYPHPVYGNIVCKFDEALKIPKGIKGGDGALQAFTIKLIEQPGIFVDTDSLPIGDKNPFSGTRLSTGSEILALTDNYITIINNSNSESQYIIQNDDTIEWLDDTVITIYQKGTGVPKFIASAGVTIHTPEGLEPCGQYGHMGIHKIGANTWAQF